MMLPRTWYKDLDIGMDSGFVHSNFANIPQSTFYQTSIQLHMHIIIISMLNTWFQVIIND